MRIGFGYDVHRLSEDRKLVLGGIEIPHTHGLLGHSDADVLLHAIADALLGAGGLGDIGMHFPDTSPKYDGADSKELLRQVVDMIHKAEFKIINIDTTIVAEKPKISPYISQMKRVISQIMGIDESAISIKATTNERMGFVGREEGIATYAVCLIESIQ